MALEGGAAGKRGRSSLIFTTLMAEGEASSETLVVLTMVEEFATPMLSIEACLVDSTGERSPNFVESTRHRSEEHTSELQSRLHLVCRLLLEKKKKRQGLAAVRHAPAA